MLNWIEAFMVMEWVVLSFKRLANCQIGLKHLWLWSGFCCLSLLFIFKIVLKNRNLSLPLVEKSQVNLWSYPFNPLKKKREKSQLPTNKCQARNKDEVKARMSISYLRPYRFSHWYDIFWIPINTGVPFRVYRYFLYL